MWYSQQTIYRTHAEIRAARPNVSFPATMPDSLLIEMGFLPVTPTDPPELPEWKPLPPVVHTCSPWQIRKALSDLGLRQAVEDAVAASTDATLKDGWAYATAFRSDDPFVIAMGESLGKTPEETAALIEFAGGL